MYQVGPMERRKPGPKERNYMSTRGGDDYDHVSPLLNKLHLIVCWVEGRGLRICLLRVPFVIPMSARNMEERIMTVSSICNIPREKSLYLLEKHGWSCDYAISG